MWRRQSTRAMYLHTLHGQSAGVGMPELQRTRQVVVADDQATFLAAAEAVVNETEGFEVCGSTQSAEEVPDLVSRLRPDVVLLDVRMPGSDPLEVAAALRLNHPEIRVLLISAFSRDDVPPEFFDLGIGFIPKEELDPGTLRASAGRLLPPAAS